MNPSFEVFAKEYFSELAKQAKRRRKICRLVDEIDEDETPNPTADDLKNLRYVFIAKRTQKNLERLEEAYSMVGRDRFDDPDSMYNTSDSPQFHRIYRVELRLCSDLLEYRRFNLCLASLIGLIFAFQTCDYGFYDTEHPESAQNIFDQFGILWREVMRNRDYETNVSVNGYVRDFEEKSRITIPISITKTIMSWSAYTVDLDRKSRKIMYQLINEINHDFRQMDYRIDAGEYKDDVIENNWIWNDVQCEEEEKKEPGTFDLNELNQKKVAELKKLCKARGFMVRGRKNELIGRLMNPEQHIYELKRRYHYLNYCKQKQIFGKDESEEKIQDYFCWLHQFHEDKYLWINNKVQRNDRWGLEARGFM